MAAEKKPLENPTREEQLTLVALFQEEVQVTELLERLSALGVDTTQATTLRVDPGTDSSSSLLEEEESSELSPATRNAVTGSILGAVAAMLIGVGLFEAGNQGVRLAQDVFSHSIIYAVVGAFLGSLVGALVAISRRSRRHDRLKSEITSGVSEGYLVAVKTSPQVAEQAEAIARQLGARRILL
jgi:hypothetical protein